MTKKITTSIDQENQIENNETRNASSEDTGKQPSRFKNREKQIEFARKKAEKQSNDLIKFLQNNRMGYEKTSFINKAHIIFQNLSQINDVNVLVGDNFAKAISIELNGIINTENGIRSKINSRYKPEEIKKAIEQLEEVEKVKIEITQKLKDLHQELRQSFPKEG